MATTQNRTVWFPKDSLLFFGLTLPLWTIGGLAWGFWMALFSSSPLIFWIFLGLLWGASVWFFYSISLAIISREISINIPLSETTMLPEGLDKAVKRLRYTLEQQSSTSFVCKPKHFFSRLFEFQQLHVSMSDGSADLIGPARIVNKVRKELLANPPRMADQATPEK
ncbi:MAG TPA: hypothetical protein VH592_23000 [Gemmataceae bacterium]|jgi:hypothetical protein